MGFRFRDVVFKVRSKLGELNQSYWSDDQIEMDINTGAQDMCSVAGSLTRYQNLVLSQTTIAGTQIGIQEVALDVEIDEIKAVKYFSGQLFDLQFHEWDSLQIGASTGSIPIYFYIKTDSNELTPQSTGTSDIIDLPIGPGSPFGATYRDIIGVWPIPPEPANIHVWYSYMHRTMVDPTDPCAVPRRWLDTLVAYAVREGLLNEKAYGEAQLWDTKYQTGREEYRVWASRQRNGSSFPSYGAAQDLPWRRSASSSVILVDQFPTM